MKNLWLKKTVSDREWKTWYGPVGNYCRLGESKYGGSNDVIVGFMTTNASVGGKIPDNCQEMNGEELRSFQYWCESNNVSPRPLKSLT